MFQDVQFFEDNLPSELDIIDISMLAFSTNIIDKFVNDILAKDKSIITKSWPELASDIPSFPMNGINTDNVFSDIYSIILSFNDINRILSSSLLAFKKSLKWIDLSITSGSVNFAFIMVANELRTYREVFLFFLLNWIGRYY